MSTQKEHIFVTEWTRLARDIENQFFKIEERSYFWSAVVNGLLAGAAVTLVAWTMATMREGDLILFACLGSSAASVVFAPLAKVNSLRSIILAYGIASLACIVLYPIHLYEMSPLPVQCGIAVGLPVTLMRLTDSMHASAIGSTLAFILFDRNISEQAMLLLAIIGLLVIVKVMAYIYLRELRFADFGREFTRGYYGKETIVTVTEAPTEEEEE